MKREERVGYSLPVRWGLPVLLALAWALRAVLAWRGGQFYFPDEARYFRSHELLRYFWFPNAYPSPFDELLSHPEHIGYVAIGTVAEALRYLGGALMGLPDYSAVRPESPFWLSAALLGGASVGSIGLIYALAIRAGADRIEALFAALLAACSTSLFYYSRHLVPYDSALALALLAAWVGIHPRPRPSLSILVGMLAGLAFLTYNGYWLSGAIAIGLHLAYRRATLPRMALRAALSGIGLTIPFLALSVLTTLRDAPSLYESLGAFATTVTQGAFSDGWTFPWEYLWHAEHGLLLAWLLGVLGVCLGLWRGWPAARTRGLLWLAAATGIYLLLALGSAVLEEFVIYGRLARQLAPYLCLATAYAAHQLWLRGKPGRVAVGAACGLVALQFGLNLVPVYQQRFPGDLERASAPYAPLFRDSTLEGCCGSFDSDNFYRQGIPSDGGFDPRYVLLNTSYLYPVYGSRPRFEGREILVAAHPIQFLPYQYESYNPDERATFRAADVRMRLLERGPAP